MRLFEREGYVLAGITGLLYLMAYFSILATANFYEIPMEVMSVDFIQLTKSAIGGIVFLLGMAAPPIVLNLWLSLGAKKPKFLYYIVVALVLAVITFFSLKSEGRFGAITGSVMISIVPLTAFWFLYYFSRTEVLNKLLSQSFKNDLNILLSLEKVRFFLIFFVSVTILVSAYFAKYVGCYALENYYIFYKKGYYAVINTSSDNVVAKKIENGKLLDGYFLFKVEALNGVEVRKENINSLAPVGLSDSSLSDGWIPLPSNRL